MQASAPCCPICWVTRTLARVIVFTRTKHGANKVCRTPASPPGIQAEALHGNKSQSAREKSLDRFRSGRARVLVATDIASRGIDVTGISHVINFDLPVEPESYVHRIGRTARAGASGIAISFCDPPNAPRCVPSSEPLAPRSSRRMPHLRIPRQRSVRPRRRAGFILPVAAESNAGRRDVCCGWTEPDRPAAGVMQFN